MFINHWSVKANIWAERRLLRHKDLSLQLALAMTLGLLHPGPWAPACAAQHGHGDPWARKEAWGEWEEDAQAQEEEHGSYFHHLARRVKADYRGAELAYPTGHQSFWLSWEGLHARSLQLAGLIAYILRTCGFDDVPRSDLLPLLPSSSSPPSPPPPLSPPSPSLPSSSSTTTTAATTTTVRIPLLEHLGAAGGGGGVRARSGAWRDWYASRVRDLVGSVGDEEWYGYYVYTLERADNLNPVGSSDPAMENIFFRLGGGARGDHAGEKQQQQPRAVTSGARSSVGSNISTTRKGGGGVGGGTPHQLSSSSFSSSSRVLLEAHGGRDGITGEFDFAGTIHTGTGVVSLRKTYKGAHYWDYDGVMTPLGIVGEWGREGTGYDGYFWLWKRSWMVGDAVQRTFAYS